MLTQRCLIIGPCRSPSRPQMVCFQCRQAVKLYCLVPALLVTILALTAPIARADQVPRTIPIGARESASEYRQEWARRATANPEFYQVNGRTIEPGKLSIGPGYLHYSVMPADAARFAEASEDDPVDFATAWSYVFPMLLDGDPVCNVHVIDNIGVDGARLRPTGGDYIVSGFAYPGGVDDLAIRTFVGQPNKISGDVRYCVIDFRGTVGVSLLQIQRDSEPRRVVPLNKAALELFQQQPTAPQLIDGSVSSRRIKNAISNPRSE